jgi:AraC-like DNA-binding protein
MKFPPPSFNTWTIIFLFAAVQGIFVSLVLFLMKRENKLGRNLLSLMILLFSLTLIEYVFYWTHYQWLYPHIIATSAAFPFLYGPILLIYFHSVFEKEKLSWKHLAHLIPFGIQFVFLTPFYFSSATDKVNKLVHPEPSFTGWHWIQIVQMLSYSIFIYWKYFRLSRSNTDVRRWFLSLNLLFDAFILSFLSYFILVKFLFFNDEWDYMISFSASFFIYFLAWFGYLQPQIFGGYTLSQAMQPVRYKSSGLTESAAVELTEKLKTHMAETKPWRDNELSLEKLATDLNTNRHNLSQIINERIGMNYFDYINRLRIEEACELLTGTSKKELNITEIAFAVGFNNKVSFNTTFKKLIGQTPSEFRKTKQLEIEMNLAKKN